MTEKLKGIDLARSKLVNVSVAYGDSEVSKEEYLQKLYGSRYFLETTRTVITTPGVLQGKWNREGSWRLLDEMDECDALERAFLEGDHQKVLQLKK